MTGPIAAIAGDEFTGTDRFRLLAKLGAGSMGAVYRAYDQQQRREVALKTLERAGATSLYRFKREFRALADVAHPNLVCLHELLSERNRWFFTMELLEGVRFRSWVYRCEEDAPEDTFDPGASSGISYATLPEPADSGAGASPVVTHRGPARKCDLERLRPALRQLVLGVDALHRAGWLHRDIKPSNVMVTREGRVVLVDFGLVTERRDESIRASIGRRVVGTPAYLSPEQAACGRLGPASDWYSVGVLLYEVLTGTLPFVGEVGDVLDAKQRIDPVAPSGLAPVPNDLDELCMALLRRRPEDRPDATELLARLGECGRPVPAVREDKRPAVFVGRTEELRALDEAYAATRAGKPIVFHLHGSSGIGKSALIEHFLERVRAKTGTTVLDGRCYERESVPYKALDSVIDALSRELRRMGRDAAAVLPRDVRSLVRLFPVLKRAKAVDAAPLDGFDIPDPQQLRRRAFGALKELFARIGDRGPLVICIDDLQWGDVDSAALLAELVRPPDAAAILLLLSYRTEDGARSACVQAMGDTAAAETRELHVGPLQPGDSCALARAFLSAADRDRAIQVACEAEGNPLFVAELARHGGREGATLEQVLLARLAQLSPTARGLLELVAVAGGPVEAQTVLRGAPGNDDGIGALAVLRAGRLVRAAGASGRIETYHDRIRETVTAHLDPARVRECHDALAHLLEEQGGADPEILAVHLHAAGQLGRAGEYAAAAARAAAEALAFDRAARLYRFALDLVPTDAPARSGLRIGLATALANAGRGAEAAAQYLAAADAAGAAREALHLRRCAAEQYLISGHVSQGMAALLVVLDGVGMKMAATPRWALMRLIRHRIRLALRGVSFRERRVEEIDASELLRVDACRAAAIGLSMIDTIHGADFQAQYTLLALRCGEPSRVAAALPVEAGHVASVGGAGAERRGGRIMRSAEALARRSSHPYGPALVDVMRGATEYLNARFRTAVELSDRAASVLRDRCVGATWEVDTASWFAVTARFYLGRYRELERQLTLLLHDARGRGDVYASTLFSTLLAQSVFLAADQPERALRELERAREQWPGTGFHIQHYWLLLGEGFTDLYAGNAARAWERVRTNWPAFLASQLPRIGMVEAQMVHLRGATALGAAAAAQTPSERAMLLRVADRAAGDLLRSRIVPFRPTGSLLRAGVCATRGERERAAHLLQEAAEGFDQAEMSLYGAAARRRHAELEAGRNREARVAAADDCIGREGIRDPARMARLLAPGLDR